MLGYRFEESRGTQEVESNNGLIIPELLGSSKFQDFSSEGKLTKWLYSY